MQAGAAGLAAASGAVLAAVPASPVLAAQSGWRWCRQCQGMWFANNSTSGKCPARPTGHSFTGSGNYTLPNNLDFNSGQQGWVWCPRCQGLWFAFTSSPGVCPAGPGGHDDLGAIRDANYALDVNSGGGQTNWRWCQQCMGLWFAGNSTNGVCPATSVGGHSLSGSGNYHIDKD